MNLAEDETQQILAYGMHSEHYRPHHPLEAKSDYLQPHPHIPESSSPNQPPTELNTSQDDPGPKLLYQGRTNHKPDGPDTHF
nr:hypothetical protein CFP56_45099 [Quercus suber]